MKTNKQVLFKVPYVFIYNNEPSNYYLLKYDEQFTY